jgi:hypothetical protein
MPSLYTPLARVVLALPLVTIGEAYRAVLFPRYVVLIAGNAVATGCIINTFESEY